MFSATIFLRFGSQSIVFLEESKIQQSAFETWIVQKFLLKPSNFALTGLPFLSVIGQYCRQQHNGSPVLRNYGFSPGKAACDGHRHCQLLVVVQRTTNKRCQYHLTTEDIGFHSTIVGFVRGARGGGRH